MMVLEPHQQRRGLLTDGLYGRNSTLDLVVRALAIEEACLRYPLPIAKAV